MFTTQYFPKMYREYMVDHSLENVDWLNVSVQMFYYQITCTRDSAI